MKAKLFTLVPERVNYESFWVEIRKRNKWLISLRFAAVGLLITLIVGGYLLNLFVPQFQLQLFPIVIITLCILIYNFIFLWLWKIFPEISRKFKVHSLHFSLLQICFDFIALMLLIYFTGGVESPFNTFYVFHLIIGSLILPGSIIMLLITIVILLALGGSILELNSIIPHYQITGLISNPLYNDASYLVVFFTTFAIVTYTAIYLANSISKVLYDRERSLTIAYRELEDAEKSKSRYVMTVVHDLKTPISASLTWVNLLLEGKIADLSSEVIASLQRIKSRLEGAIELINNILTISQVKISGKYEAFEEIDLAEMFNDIYIASRVLFTSKNIKFNVLLSQPKIVIKSDPKWLKLALSNLISNAQKYTEPNGVVEVKITEREKDVEIIVADNGIGIPKNELPKVFSEFYRSSISKQRNIEGTGLGVALVKEIVTRFGGNIVVDSPSYLQSEGRPGTQFTVVLPKRLD
jgi:signal transduction histidine kinase